MRKTCYANVTKKIIHPCYLFQKLEYAIAADWGKLYLLLKIRFCVDNATTGSAIKV